MFSGIAELERDIIIERTWAGQESARQRGVKFGRKRGFTKETKQKAILAETYYRDETKQLSVKEICILCDIGSKATLYRYLMYQGRRNCVVCNAYFWEKNQERDNAFCEKHKKKNKHIDITCITYCYFVSLYKKIIVIFLLLVKTSIYGKTGKSQSTNCF